MAQLENEEKKKQGTGIAREQLFSSNCFFTNVPDFPLRLDTFWLLGAAEMRLNLIRNRASEEIKIVLAYPIPFFLIW